MAGQCVLEKVYRPWTSPPFSFLFLQHSSHSFIRSFKHSNQRSITTLSSVNMKFTAGLAAALGAMGVIASPLPAEQIEKRNPEGINYVS